MKAVSFKSGVLRKAKKNVKAVAKSAFNRFKQGSVATYRRYRRDGTSALGLFNKAFANVRRVVPSVRFAGSGSAVSHKKNTLKSAPIFNPRTPIKLQSKRKHGWYQRYLKFKNLK